MGKVRLKSSLRALQIALAKLKGNKIHLIEEEEGAAATRNTSTTKTITKKTSKSNAWSFSCAQPKTHSFRVAPTTISRAGEDVYKSFNSLYLVSDLKSSASQSLCPLPEEEEQLEQNFSGVSNRSTVIICDEKGRICDEQDLNGVSKRSAVVIYDERDVNGLSKRSAVLMCDEQDLNGVSKRSTVLMCDEQDLNGVSKRSTVLISDEKGRICDEQDLNGVSKRSTVLICDEKGRIYDAADCSHTTLNWDESWFLDEEESLELEFTSKSSSYSSDFSSESSRSSDLLAGLVRGLSSQRFFFSPGRSNSILEEAKCLQTSSTQEKIVQVDDLSGREKIDMPFLLDKRSAETDLDLSLENETEGGCQESMDLSMTQTESIAENEKDDKVIYDIFLRDSVAMMMYSRNPYLDFRISMQEMVEAHNLKDWSCLQELLCCYLSLNKKKTHKFIVGAFADLLMNIITTKSSNDPLLDCGSCTD
eukprot:Gb_27629 [translate_table: standard]